MSPIPRRWVARLAAAAALGVLAATPNLLFRSAAVQAAPAPLPATRLEFGLANGPADLSWMTSSGVPWKYRYTYLAGGVNVANPWEKWQDPALPPGQYALDYMNNSRANGYIPVFSWYELLQSTPSTGANESDRDFNNLNNAATMNAYYSSFKTLMSKAGAFGQQAVVHIEPDFWGYMQGRTSGDASTVSASVASSGFTDVAAYPNTVQGFGQALLHMRDLYAPKTLLAVHASPWSNGGDIGMSTNPGMNAVAIADATAAFLMSAGNWDAVFNDLDDHDAGYWETQGRNHWWDPTNATFPNFTRYLTWVGELKTKTGKQQVAWQVPEGNQYFLTMNNTCGHYQDNVAPYFIAHPSDLFAAGLVAVLFGKANGCQTTTYDVGTNDMGGPLGDGVTNNNGAPTSDAWGWCNACNTHTSTFADDDGGYIRIFVGQYYTPVPGAPTNVTATAGDQSSSLTWTAPSSTGGSAITSYVITAYDGCTIQGSMTVTGAPPATNATFSSLTNGTAYTFTVAAVNSYGAGPASSPSNGVNPNGAAPTWVTACSTQQYTLANSDGATWKDMDASRLAVSFTPTVNSYAVITANADLWTRDSGYNQDIGVTVSGGAYPTSTGQPEAWKESGGSAGTFSPNAAFLQTVIPVTAAIPYAVKLQWKTNHGGPATIVAGAGPITGAFSPTRLTVRIVPVSSGVVFTKAITGQPCLMASNGATWQDVDPNLNLTFNPPPGSWLAVMSGNADLFTSTSGFNQDLGITLSGGGYPTVAGQPEAWKESGGSAGVYSPNAAYVQTAIPVTGGAVYSAKLQWKANGPGNSAIHMGAGPIGPNYSPTRISVLLVPNPSGATVAATTLQNSQSNSNGTTWQAMDLSALKLTLSPSVNTSYEISANSDLWTKFAGYNQDIGLMVSGGAYGSGTLVAWKESGGLAGTYSPNAAYVATELHLQTGNTYTVWVVWKANQPPFGPSTIFAGAGPIGTRFSLTSLHAVALL